MFGQIGISFEIVINKCEDKALVTTSESYILLGREPNPQVISDSNL